MDLRGEITAVIDPRVHFPVSESRSGRERLLVLDRSSDRQSAAIRVDEVIGVETVPESDVIDADTVDASELSGEALDHPLVLALVTQERKPEPEPRVGHVTTDGSADSGVETPEAGATVGGGDSAALSSACRTSGVGEPIGEASRSNRTRTPATTSMRARGTIRHREIIVEATALVDIDRLLLASGNR